MTHAVDVDQRYVELKISSRGPSSITVQVPGDRYLLPSGMYLLFVSWSRQGNPAGAHVPSVAKWRRVPVQ